MFTKKNLLLTVKISLIVQVITGLLALAGIFIKVSKENQILNHILILETGVQIIEFIFYIYLVYFLHSLDNDKIASQRYFDWMFTTPVMLFSTILFLEYEHKRELNQIATIPQIVKDHGNDIFWIVIFNFGMLLFGYLGEINKLMRQISIPIGFIFFGLSFNLIWDRFARMSTIGSNIFYLLLVIWSLYGVAAMLNTIPKNLLYNLLDIISKNFYGLFILFLILKRQ